MANCKVISVSLVLICLTVAIVESLPVKEFEHSIRLKRDGFLDKLFGRNSETTTTTTPKPPIQNNLEIGKCDEDDKLIYVDDTRLESNNSTLSGALEVYLDSPYTITCIKLFDQLPAGTGAIPTYNSGGQGHKFVIFDVEGQYGHGIHFKIFVWGKLDKRDDESENLIHS